MKKTARLLTSSLLLAAGSVSAGTMGPVLPQDAWVATFSMGPAWESSGRTQTFFLTPDIEKTYTAKKSTNALLAGEFFYGYQYPLWMLQSQIGLDVAATSYNGLSGVIWDDADPLFDNYIYGYQVRHTRVGLKGKLLANEMYGVIPWISGSVNAGFNYAHGYYNTPVIPEAVRNPDFGNHYKTTFAYTGGAGIQKAMGNNWQVGIGYEYTNWGKSNLARAAGQTLNTGLRLRNINTNALMINLTFLTA